jgi:hypothetical protein
MNALLDVLSESLSFPNVTRGKGAIVCEGRIGDKGLIHPGWEEVEPNLVVALLALTVTRASAQVSRPTAWRASMSGVERARMPRAMASVMVFDAADCRLGDEVRAGN